MIEQQVNLSGLAQTEVQDTIKKGFFGLGGTQQVNFNVDKDFVGIDQSNINLLTDDINKLIGNVEAILQEFGGNEDTFNPGLKGQANNAAVGYVKAIKELMAEYIAYYKSFIKLADEVSQTYTTNDEGNKQAIENAASEIRNMASQINVD